MLLRFQYNDYLANYRLPSATVAQFGELVSEFRKSRNNPKITKNDAVVRTFFKAIDLWPHINPSDIWWFIISRVYLDPYNHPATEINRDLSQSWKRTNGWALEIIIVNHYKDFLGRYGITIGIYPKTRKQQLLSNMGLNYHVEEAKADVLLVNDESDECFGVIHVKASIAERRQNDQNFSLALLKKNYFSPFMTMD